VTADVLALVQFAAGPDGISTTGHRVVPVGDPVLSALDLAATRGDGVFETISVGRGAPQALEPHLVRFARSARMLDLPAPDLDAWRAIVLDVAGRLAAHDEAWIKTVLTRGVEGADVPTAWASGAPSADFSAARTEGVAVALLDRGVRSDVASSSPWLLAGAKTLSYAVNMAAKREAARRGADDVVFVSTDGALLEGPTATLILRRGDLLSTPRADLGILAGTTQADVFAWAHEHGLRTEHALLSPSDLASADAAWLVSSVRHAAPLRAVDGAPLAVDVELSNAMNRFLATRVR
jgi:4-amino-4-deoxychorismate lyase